MARLIEPPGGEGPVNEGERRVVRALMDGLSRDYVVIPNIEIAEVGGQRFEYDVVVLAPHAIYAVETKDWSGNIIGDHREWLVNGRSRKAPVIAIERKAKVLKSKLVDVKQAYARVWVEAVVVLARPPATLDLTPQAAERVFAIPEILAFISDPEAIGRGQGSILELQPMLARAIVDRGRPRQHVLRFGDYEIVETLEQDDQEALYLAQHKDLPGAPPVRLRVVTLSPYLLGEQERASRRQQLFRAFEALLRMGSHPNVIAARLVFEDDDGRMVLVLDGAEGRSLRQRLRDGTPLTVEERIGILVELTRALVHAHSHGVVHRRVEPERLLIDDSHQTRLSGFELSKIMTEAASTVWSDEAAATMDRRYLAPELHTPDLGQVSPATDLYGLGCIAYELFAGSPPFDTPDQAYGEPPNPPDEMPAGLRALLPGLLRADPNVRTADTKAVLATLGELGDSGSPQSATGPKSEYQPGDLIDGKFEVRALLGKGGFSRVYRVYRALEDREFALKVFNESDAFEKVQREIRVLREIEHPHIVRVVWADQTQAKQWYLVSELVVGEPLSEYAEGGKVLAPDEAVHLVLDLLAALEVIHPDERRIAELKAKAEQGELDAEEFAELQELRELGIVHRDIKPQNLVLADRGVVLIDFNIASRVGEPVVTLSGTPPYQAPDANLTEWTVSTDLFATGVVLYELICHEHPYENRQPHVDRVPHDPRQFRPDLAPALCEFLIKAAAPIAKDRFTSAREMRAALSEIDPLTVAGRRAGRPGLPPGLSSLLDARVPNVNPFVREFLALGSQARITNRATRGLTELAQATYVATRLDEELAEALLAARHRLVVITGNAGDGKTAFIQRTEALARERGADVEQAGENGSVLQYAGHTIVTLYDGSQDEEGRTSDAVLCDFFEPVVAESSADETIRMAAINEGRLRDFILTYRGQWPRLLGLLEQLDDPVSADGSEIVVINLNLRSVTSGGEDSIFTRQLRALVDGPFWDACQDCEYRARCPIKHNVDTFRDPTSGPAVSERLRRLVDIARLRRRLHLTMRDVRSLLSTVVFRDRTCEEIAEILRSDDPLPIVDLAYFQGAGGLGAPSGTMLDRGIDVLIETDVALVANPVEDRAMASGQLPRRMSFTLRDGDYPTELLQEARRRAGVGYESDATSVQRTHDGTRRLVFFERSDDGWWSMLPYRRLRELETALDPDAHAERSGVRDDILRALSAAEGVRDRERSAGALWLATAEELEGGMRSYRRFTSEEFELRLSDARERYVESAPDQLELVHLPTNVTLPIGVDLLEILERLYDGHVPSLDEARGLLINLQLFKNRLLAEPASELLLISEDGQYRVVAGPAGAVELLDEPG